MTRGVRRALAVVSLYSPPHKDLLKQPYDALLSRTYERDAGIRATSRLEGKDWSDALLLGETPRPCRKTGMSRMSMCLFRIRCWVREGRDAVRSDRCLRESFGLF